MAKSTRSIGGRCAAAHAETPAEIPDQDIPRQWQPEGRIGAKRCAVIAIAPAGQQRLPLRLPSLNMACDVRRKGKQWFRISFGSLRMTSSKMTKR